MKKIEEMRAAHLAARKARNAEATTLIGYLIGECTKKDKEPTDADVVSIIKKFVKSMNETPITSPADFIEQCKRDAVIASQFLPTQMTDEQIVEEVKAIITTNPSAASNFGMVVKEMAAKFTGLYDNGTLRAKWLAITETK